MNKEEIVYAVFGILIVLSLLFDLLWISRKGKSITIRQAILQTVFWISIALGFFAFMWYEEGEKTALEYISSYLMEWSLSIDNIFVFILIFTSFDISPRYYGSALLLGIIMAIVFRVIFIFVGVSLIERFDWILYVFGVFLLYTGAKLLFNVDNKEYNPRETAIFRFLSRFLPFTNQEHNGKYWVKEEGKTKFTILFIVVLLLGFTDLIFAMDSIPAVMGISRHKIVIFTSNILAVLGLRSLFFLLKGAVLKFYYLQHGISFVLIFIGIKMLLEHWINAWIEEETQVILSLGVIITCIAGSIIFSLKKTEEADKHIHG